MLLMNMPPRMGAETSACVYWDGFLNDSEINEILAMPEWHEKQEGKTGMGAGEVSQSRRSQVSWMLPSGRNHHLWQRIVDLASTINAKHFRFDLTGCYEAAQLTTYTSQDQGYYDWHIDAVIPEGEMQFEMAPRKLSMSLLLSDPAEFAGGELQIKTNSDAPITLEQKRGRAFFFPSYALHRVAPVTWGVRRSLVLWFGGPQFR